MPTLEYAPGRRADLVGVPAATTALLWHGRQTDSRAAVRPLAEALAQRGVGVIAADWDSHADDRGRADLLASARFAHAHATPDPLVLIGWSMGGAAAAGLTLRAHQFDIAVVHTVCLAGAFMADDPISGDPLLHGAGTGAVRTPFTLFCGDTDDVVPARAATEFAAQLRTLDWPTEVIEVAADHGSIAGARYDAAADRYEPATDPGTVAIAAGIAAQITDRVVGIR